VTVLLLGVSLGSVGWWIALSVAAAAFRARLGPVVRRGVTLLAAAWMVMFATLSLARTFGARSCRRIGQGDAEQVVPRWRQKRGPDVCPADGARHEAALGGPRVSPSRVGGERDDDTEERGARMHHPECPTDQWNRSGAW
jgi:hypothetical protein